jgi:hypothetical protein
MGTDKESTMKRSVVLLAVALIAMGGCYHATIETGLPSSSEVIQQDWASGWIYGLVPPSTVSTAEKCPNGVAKVETQQSFLNLLVHAITFGIYTPMAIKVTCASAATGEVLEVVPDMAVPVGAGETEIQEVFALAARKAMEENRPVFVRF